MSSRLTPRVSFAVLLSLLSAAPISAGSDLPPFEKVSEGFEKIEAPDGSLYTLYANESKAQMLAELPKDFEKQRLFIHNVVAGGSPLAGVGLLMSGERFVYWKRIGDKLALMEPEQLVRASGRDEDKRSREMMYTDRVLTSVPVLTTGPGGGPVIDLDALLVGGSTTFFGSLTAGADASLSRITKKKVFPKNLEVAFELPLGARSSGTPAFGLSSVPSPAGRMTELHYSVRLVPDKSSYKPRLADPRVGYFTTAFNDLSKTTDGDETWVRYITRWNLEKADPKLKLSPPKEPITWYIEHTTPIKFRRPIRKALLDWNLAFEKIGIVGAVEVRQQDASTGAYMDLDPEDMRYNFIRWNNNQAGFAIGPSRSHPETGQIFDADVTMNAGVVASFSSGVRSLLPALAIEGFGPETMAWLDEHPEWDPRIRMAAPEERARLLSERAAKAAAGELGQYPATYTAGLGASLRESWERAGIDLDGHAIECFAGAYAALSTDLVRIATAVEEAADGADGAKEEQEYEDLIDGLPEEYVEQLLHWLTLHEVGHCLGLRHNFKASTLYDLAEINSADFPADQATGGSVMEYTPANINNGLGDTQGQWLIHQPGPYDYWAIEYGYGFGDEKKVLERSSDPSLVYADNMDDQGPDPRVRVYDFGKDPIEFCESRMRIIRDLRPRIITDVVKDGESWGKARKSFASLMNQHVTALSIAANWVGGSFVNKDVKGQPGGRPPVQDIPAEMQRKALDFVIANSFEDEAFGLTEELMRHLSVDRWGDFGDQGTWSSDQAIPAHDIVSSVQSAAITMVMNPTTLRRVFDNEFRAQDGTEVLTLVEVLDRVVDAAFTEFKDGGAATVSSLRRNLQAELVDRLIALALDGGTGNAASRTLSQLGRDRLRGIGLALEKQASSSSKGDAYTRAHVADLQALIEKALDAPLTMSGR